MRHRNCGGSTHHHAATLRLTGRVDPDRFPEEVQHPDPAVAICSKSAADRVCHVTPEMLERLTIQRILVTEGEVDAGPIHVHGRREIIERRSRKPSRPEHISSCSQGNFTIMQFRPTPRPLFFLYHFVI